MSYWRDDFDKKIEERVKRDFIYEFYKEGKTIENIAEMFDEYSVGEIREIIYEKSHAFCEHCNKEQLYDIKTVDSIEEVNDEDFPCQIEKAFCKECGAEVELDDLPSKNRRVIDRQYREKYDLIRAEDIERLQRKFAGVTSDSLSLVLGISPNVLLNYLRGEFPAKEHSDTIKKALGDPEFMCERIRENTMKFDNFSGYVFNAWLNGFMEGSVRSSSKAYNKGYRNASENIC